MEVKPLSYKRSDLKQYVEEFDELFGKQTQPVVSREFFQNPGVPEQLQKCCYNIPTCKPLHYTTIQVPGQCMICLSDRTAIERTAFLMPCGHGTYCPSCCEEALGLVSTDEYYMYRCENSKIHERYEKHLEDLDKELNAALDQNEHIRKLLLDAEKSKGELNKMVTFERKLKCEAIRRYEDQKTMEKQHQEEKSKYVKMSREREETIQELKFEITELNSKVQTLNEKHIQVELEITELLNVKRTLETSVETLKNKLNVSRSASQVYERGSKRRSTR